MSAPKPCMLLILDGWGLAPAGPGNAVTRAKTPYLDGLTARYPHTQLACSGEDVGLPEGIMGNSEVGHLNLGAGRVVYQDLVRIDRAIRDGSFFDNPALGKLMETVREKGSALHFMGLVSDGGVHSQLTHLLALVDMARQKGVGRLWVHAILDGRDTPPDSGAGYVARLQAHLDSHGFGRIATICGRFYAMDRDKRWDRVEQAFRLYTEAEGSAAADPRAAVQAAYAGGQTDEFVTPITLAGAEGRVRDGDGIVFFNFRADRAREITRAFTQAAFDGFQRRVRPTLCGYVCMTLYDEHFDLPLAFGPVHLDRILGQVVSQRGLRQLRIAETEKYAHVTYFFNGGEETPFQGEERCLIPSPRDVATYDLKPAMSAAQVAAEAVRRIETGSYDLVVLNFANCDMVGHTGVLQAALAAVETVDRCAAQVVEAVRARGGVVLVTADHGNAEKMLDDSGHPFTAHTTNPVALILVDDTRLDARLVPGRLGDVAPTILEILGIDPPPEMTGRSLLTG